MRVAEPTGMDIDDALLEAAKAGDVQGVQAALANGANVNAEDASGRPVFFGALTGEGWHDLNAIDASYLEDPTRLEILRLFLQHPALSLCTLNAPHQKHLHGVTPLGITTWLNIPSAVDLFLEAGEGKILVDGADAYGATPLMYAARDGNLEVLKHLLCRGAKPDLRDVHHRTAIQFAASADPDILWHCEEALRVRRVHCALTRTPRSSISAGTSLDGPGCQREASVDSILPSHFSAASWSGHHRPATDLIEAITNNDLLAIRDFLPRASPLQRDAAGTPRSIEIDPIVLVNLPDARGWSAIHHAVAVPRPSVSILDALYLAGADVSLFTADNDARSPLHCLALSSAPAPTGDADPHSFSPLYSLALHLVRDLRAPLAAVDQQGETCIHLAAERGRSIDVLLAFLDCDVNKTVREIKNHRGLTALQIARPQFQVAFGVDHVRPLSTASERTIKASPSNTSLSTLASLMSPPASPTAARSPGTTPAMTRSLLDALQSLPTTADAVDPDDVDDLQRTLARAAETGTALFTALRARAARASTELQRARRRHDRVTELLSRTSVRLDDSAMVRPSHTPRPGSTARKRSESVGAGRRKAGSEDSEATKVELGMLPASFMSMGSLVEGKDGASSPKSPGHKVHLKGWLEAWRGHGHAASVNLPKIAKESKLEMPIPPTHAHGGLRRRVRSYTDVRSRANTWSQWLKGKLRAELYPQPAILEVVQEAERPPSMVLIKDLIEADIKEMEAAEASRPLHDVLVAADRDLRKMEHWLSSGDELSSRVRESISLAERILQRYLKKKRSVIEATELSPPTSPLLSSRHTSFLNFPASPSSARSSAISLASTLTDANDQDLRQLRRLLTRKIVARLDLAYDEIDKLEGGIRVVRDLVRGVDRRAAML